MSVIHEQSMLLASCRSEQDIQYLENFLKNSIEKTPLKQISGNANQQNPESLRQTQLIYKEQNLKKTQSAPKPIKSQLFEEPVQLKHQICIISFRDRQTKQELNLRKQSSFFECFGCGDTYVACRYRFRRESSFQIYINHQEQPRQQLIFCINFNTISAQINCDQQNQLIYFEIITKRNYLTFSTQPSEASYLKTMFQNIEKNNLGKQIDLCNLQTRQEYYRQRYDTQQYFVNNCQTGDILLFQDNHFAAKVQRFITGSNFDHVGMVVRDPHYGILIFESNSNSGVCLTLWKSVISNRWYKLIPKISWRRLTKIERNLNFQAKIKKFLMQNLQKSFHIGSRVITANQSVIIADEKDNTMQKASGFFCSELIATLYKNLGLITRDRQNPNYQPACKFYPKDFSELSKRQLDQGQLSPESQIYFDPKLLCRNYPDLKFGN